MHFLPKEAHVHFPNIGNFIQLFDRIYLYAEEIAAKYDIQKIVAHKKPEEPIKTKTLDEVFI